MALEEFLAPGENVRYKSSSEIEYQGSEYYFIITDRRIIWYNQIGHLFKKNNFVSTPIEEVKEISYSENGMIKKKGTIKIQLVNKYIEFTGGLQSIRAIYNEMQAYMSSPASKTIPPKP